MSTHTSAADQRAWRLANPEKVRANNRRHYLRHREKIQAQTLAYYQTHREERARTTRAYYLWTTFRMTPDDYEMLGESQDWRCKHCKTPAPGGIGRFHIDHDHATSEVRGLLCFRCNITDRLGSTP
jgi:hypothetical protein